LFALLILGATVLCLAGPGRAQAARLASDPAASSTPVSGQVGGSKLVYGPSGSTPTATQGVGQGPDGAGWENQALRDLAEMLDWPLDVRVDANGRRSVQHSVDLSHWSQAVIRSFDFPAGAQAAFQAEQEDAIIAGYQVTTETFYSYPAYWATMLDGSGQVIERRFHWLAQSWVMGVDIHENGPQASEPRQTATQLLILAVQYGLPAPQGTPLPTIQVRSSVTPSATSTPSCDVYFTDVDPAYWAYDYITQLACNGIVSGYGDGTFRPQNSTTRAQLVKMIVLSNGWPLLEPTQPTFSDVGTLHTFYHYVETARARGVVSGYGNGTFKPDAFVTRAEVAKMLVRARGWEMLVGSPVNLCDVPQSHWASTYIQVAIAHGVFSGYGDGCFRPDELATRAQLAKVLSLIRR
jgi:hypothetical protein